MAATLMDGAALAAKVRAALKEEVAELGGLGLATVLVGDDPASQIYIRLKHEAADEVGIRAIDKIKDVDGLHRLNAGHLFSGRQTLVPATPVGIMQLLDEYRIPLAGARAVVVGRSLIVGRPLALLLLHQNATV